VLGRWPRRVFGWGMGLGWIEEGSKSTIQQIVNTIIDTIIIFVFCYTVVMGGAVWVPVAMNVRWCVAVGLSIAVGVAHVVAVEIPLVVGTRTTPFFS
jgi:hypothetical protein